MTFIVKFIPKQNLHPNLLWYFIFLKIRLFHYMDILLQCTENMILLKVHKW